PAPVNARPLVPNSVGPRGNVLSHERLSHQPLQAAFAASNPFGVIRFSDLYTGMPKQPGDVLQLHSTNQRANAKGVAQQMRSAIGDACPITDSLHALIDGLGERCRVITGAVPERSFHRQPFASVNTPFHLIRDVRLEQFWLVGLLLLLRAVRIDP